MKQHLHASGLLDRPFESFPILLASMIRSFNEADVLELGAGRSPSYAIGDLPSNLRSYGINDIDPNELARAPAGYDAFCFDATGDVSEFTGRYDVIFSRTLAEHVKSGRSFHRNVFALLKPGGVAIHMIPTLYFPPFVLNRLMPERLSRKLLYAFRPYRRNDVPKFPAHYSWCYGNRTKMEDLLKSVGFSEVDIRSFYGHDYFTGVPVLGRIDRAVTDFAKRRDISSLAAYAHVITYKG